MIQFGIKIWWIEQKVIEKQKKILKKKYWKWNKFKKKEENGKQN